MSIHVSRTPIAVVISAALFALPMTGCENLPGDEQTQGAVAGGVGGAAAGALIGGEDNRLLGGLIGGALGAGGGYLIGQQVEKSRDDDDDVEEAREANRKATNDPATVDEARDAASADINNDGFVTLDEVAALDEAGLTDDQIEDRIRATGQVFALTQSQERYLLDRGISRDVVRFMRDVNRESVSDTAQPASGRGSEVIGGQ